MMIFLFLDDDSYSDFEEFIEGTDPTDPNDNPGATPSLTPTTTDEGSVSLILILTISLIALIMLQPFTRKKR